MSESPPRAATATCVGDLLEASWASRGRPMGLGERRVELGATVVFVAVAASLIALAPTVTKLDPAVGVLVAAYAVATRVNFPIGLAGTVPTQLFLVPLFFAAPAQAVPALVAAGLALGHLIGFAAGQGPLDRLACVGGDALHAVGPAAVLLLAADGDAATAPAWVLGIALAAQFPVDLLSGMAREHLISGVAPKIQTLVQLGIWAADIALAPIGFLAARATDGPAGAAVLLLPLTALLAYVARDRRQRIGTALDRLTALHAERERLRQAVRRIGSAFASNLDSSAILEVVTATVGDALQADATRVTLRGADATPAAHDLAAALRLSAEEVARAGYLKIARAGAVHSVACPLHSIGAVLSVARRGKPYDYEERSLLAYLCGQADVAASNAELHHSFRRQAVTDELTGLANHRRFQEVLDAWSAEHADHGGEFALLLLDLDDFKLVNDVHGHLTGDEVLRQVGRCLGENCRSTDQPARYGSEEFAVVLKGMDVDQVLAFGERLRKAIADAVVRSPDGEQLSITASIGIARMEREDVPRRDLIAAADAALYDAKHRGKNCVAWVDLDDSAAPRPSWCGSEESDPSLRVGAA